MQIHIHAKQGNIKGVAAELAKGTKINCRDKQSSKTPLMCAISSPDAGSDMVRYLVDHGANVSGIEKKSKKTVLSLAVQSGNLDKVQLLLDAGADLHYQSEHGYDVLIDAMYSRDIKTDKNLIPMLKLLLERGAPVNGISSYGESAIKVASRVGRFDVVQVLLAAGADADQLQWTELMHAIALEPLETVKELLDTSPDIDTDLYARDFWNRSPWLLSLQVGDVDKAKLLLAAGAYRDDYGHCGKTPLMYAIENNRVEILEWLIQAGFDIEATDEFAMTPLMMAAECGATDCVRILLDRGADPGKVNHCDYRAIKLADNIEIVRMLVQAGEDLSDIDDEMRPALTGIYSDEIQATEEQYLAGRYRRFGKANPDVMDILFWQAMVRNGASAYGAKAKFGDTDNWEQPVWCYHRFGRTITELSDGKIIEIAGEHEDYYDPDFCIYNDVVVYHGDGTFTILGYPKDVFPPTDFHTSTLVGDYIYIIGNLGYYNERIPHETPVYRLHTDTFAIEKVKTTGDKPGWLSRHKAYYKEPSTIYVTGGKVHVMVDEKSDYIDNTVDYTLDLTTLVWSQADSE